MDFWGRVYRINPPNPGFEWHSDNKDSRVAAITVNLTARPYCGGTLYLKNLKKERQNYRLPNLEFGNAILFGISPAWKHKVSRVTGHQPKIAFSGWFFSKRHASKIESVRSKALQNKGIFSSEKTDNVFGSFFE